MEIDTVMKKRNVAYKLRVGDILKGKPMTDNGKFLFLELGDKKISRVNIIANCVDKYVQTGEKKYASITIDDASGQLRIKAFGDDVGTVERVMQGDTLQIVGNVREWNGELYLLPEILKKVDPKWLLIRKLEIQKSKKDITPEQTKGLHAQLLQIIKDAETQGGVDVDEIIMNVEASPESINGEIKKLLEEGLIYEPRPGRLRYLGG